jgi:uncharacterized membrane protein
VSANAFWKTAHVLSAAVVVGTGLGIHAWFRRWFALGVPAFVAVIAIYWLMVAKPLAVPGG